MRRRHKTIFKTAISALFGVVAALALFLAMHGMIVAGHGGEPPIFVDGWKAPVHEIRQQTERPKVRKPPPRRSNPSSRLARTPVDTMQFRIEQ